MNRNFMHPYYKGTVLIAGGFAVMLGFGCLLASGWSSSEAARCQLTREKARKSIDAAEHREAEYGRLRLELLPIRVFTKAWAPYVAVKPDQDLSGVIRTSLEDIAQRKLSLVTDQTTTPIPSDLTYQGQTFKAQRISIRALGGNLPALLTWLGEAEKAWPYARVEQCSIQALNGSNMAIVLSLAQPLPPKKPASPAAQ